MPRNKRRRSQCGAKSSDDQNGTFLDWPTAPPLPSEWPPAGKYPVVCQGKGRIVTHFSRRAIELMCEILEPAVYRGFKLSMYCALPEEGASCSDRSKYYEQWVLANGGPPQCKTRMTPRVFKGLWLAEVVRTKKNADGPLPEGQVGRPVIDHLIERLAGGPLQ